MKLKNGFLLREVGGTHVVVPIGERVVDFNGLVTLNETGRFLWERLMDGSDEASLVRALTDEYEVNDDDAVHDVHAFVCDLADKGLLDSDA